MEIGCGTGRITFPVVVLLILVLALLAAGCGATRTASLFDPAPTDSPASSPLVTPLTTATFVPTWTPQPTVTWTTTPTPDPYAELSIDHLASRDYGGDRLEIVEVLAENSYFTRYLVTYPSEDLTIYGFMNVPHGEGPFPVIIALHGYIDPEIYTTLDYTTGYADALARSGYLILHPNLRGYRPSDDGPNLFRVGMAQDVLNLIAVAKDQGGQAGPLEKADPARIGLWGHSMGGGISTRVITVSLDVDAAVLYGSMSSDEKRNFEAVFEWSEGQRGLEELSVPEEALTHISPIYYLERIQAPVSIHHGESDALVPLEWSLDLCERLQNLSKSVECFTYPGQPHTFYGEGEQLLIQRMVAFYDRYLKAP